MTGRYRRWLCLGTRATRPTPTSTDRGGAPGPTLKVDVTSMGGPIYVRDYPDDVDPESGARLARLPVFPERRPSTRHLKKRVARMADPRLGRPLPPGGRLGAVRQYSHVRTVRSAAGRDERSPHRPMNVAIDRTRILVLLAGTICSPPWQRPSRQLARLAGGRAGGRRRPGERPRSSRPGPRPPSGATGSSCSSRCWSHLPSSGSGSGCAAWIARQHFGRLLQRPDRELAVGGRTRVLAASGADAAVGRRRPRPHRRCRAAEARVCSAQPRPVAGDHRRLRNAGRSFPGACRHCPGRACRGAGDRNRQSLRLRQPGHADPRSGR